MSVTHQKRHSPRAFSDLELDLIALEKIPHDLLVKEVELYRVKWWDYRFIHPTEATYAFANAYERAYRQLYAVRYDKFEAQTVKVFNNQDPLKDTTQTVLGLWTARQKADELGIRYDLYCHAGLNYSEQVFTDLARVVELTLPNVVELIQERWVIRNACGLVRPEIPQYADKKWANHPYVQEWHKVSQAARKA